MSDGLTNEIRDRLKQLDESDEMVTAWEAGFIESVCYKYTGELSTKQLDTASEILQKYGY